MEYGYGMCSALPEFCCAFFRAHQLQTQAPPRFGLHLSSLTRPAGLWRKLSNRCINSVSFRAFEQRVPNELEGEIGFPRFLQDYCLSMVYSTGKLVGSGSSLKDAFHVDSITFQAESARVSFKVLFPSDLLHQVCASEHVFLSEGSCFRRVRAQTLRGVRPF